MRLAVMQPYFFPYAGYFRLIAAVDRFVVFDTAQFLRRGWMHRNRIGDGAGGWRWIRVPLRKAPQATPIADMKIRDAVDWRQQILRDLAAYAPDAPGFRSTRTLVQRCLDVDTDRLAALNVHVLAALAAALGLDFAPLMLSETGVDPGPCGDPQERVLSIAAALGATEVVNLPGGRSLYDPAAFARRGIRLSFVDAAPSTGREMPAAAAALSIVDDLMRTSPGALAARLRDGAPATSKAPDRVP